jgi:hypothetical protein
VTQLENHPKIPSNARAAVLFAEVREAFLAIQAMVEPRIRAGANF